ncbi:MFS transporter [Bacillus sp. N447-1]|uniref:MFS transporter n=1 Tax=Bacillus sp. N447-1 TaxID=2789208 RepID=UPI0024938F66|nr:MFS transporter [Bacillus sp. N447-1]
MPSMQATVLLLAPKEHLTQVAGWGQMVSSVSNIAGPAIGMSLLAVSSFEWVLLLDVIGALIACSILLCIRIPNAPKAEQQISKGVIGEMKEGYNAIVKRPLLLKLAISTTIVGLLFLSVGTYFPLMVRNHFEKRCSGSRTCRGYICDWINRR